MMELSQFIFNMKDQLDVETPAMSTPGDFIHFLKDEHPKLLEALRSKYEQYKWEQTQASQMSATAKVMNSIPGGKI